MGAAVKALLQPLAQHLTGGHAWVPLPNNQKFGFELTDVLHNFQCVDWCNFTHLKELLAGLKVGNSGGSITQPDNLIKALHAQVSAGRLDEGVKLESADLSGGTGVGGFGDLHVDAVAARVWVLKGPGAGSRGESRGGGENAKKSTLLQCGTRGRGRSGGRAGGQTQENQDKGQGEATDS